MKKVLLTFAIVLCLLGGGYFLINSLGDDVFYSAKFPEKTTINGIDCSDLSIDEAAAVLTDKWNGKQLTFVDKTEELGSVKLTGLTYDINDQLKHARKSHSIATAMNHLFGTSLDMKIPMEVAGPSDEFTSALKDADFLHEDEITETENAYIDLRDPELPVIDEVYGNNIDYALLETQINQLIAKGTFTIPYVEAEFYEQPEITANSEELLERQEFYKENMICKVTYTLGEDTVIMSPYDFAKIRGVRLSSSGKLTDDEMNAIKNANKENVIIEDAVIDFVYQFACDYNTLGSTRTFKTSYGKTIEVPGGAYGFALDQTAEAQQLISDLKSGKSIKRDPVWLMTGFNEYKIGDDIGDTYVEISINKQHLWYYKDGKKIVDTDVVTGNPYMGYSTPTGTYGLSYKQYGATLRGEEADGTEYESPVTYWMPFFGNYGMHDATWRWYFGGNIYLGGGSHGCVNMPYEAAGKVFDNIADRNVPIIIYNE